MQVSCKTDLLQQRYHLAECYSKTSIKCSSFKYTVARGPVSDLTDTVVPSMFIMAVERKKKETWEQLSGETTNKDKSVGGATVCPRSACWVTVSYHEGQRCKAVIRDSFVCLSVLFGLFFAPAANRPIANTQSRPTIIVQSRSIDLSWRSVAWLSNAELNVVFRLQSSSYKRNWPCIVSAVETCPDTFLTTTPTHVRELKQWILPNVSMRKKLHGHT